jgi:GH25 family lysozyme M1 (1,4-beta-N-acetylmuramidase)
MLNDLLAFGIDLSKFNTSQDGKKKVNFDTIAAHQPTVTFVGMRTGISWGYQDPWFSYYFQETARIGRARMPYHVIYPGESPVTQMDNFFRILGDTNFATVPLVLDLEIDHGQSRTRITWTTVKCIEIITSRTGRIPIIYSRATWVNQFLSVVSLPPVYWWLAQYRYSWPYPLYTPEYPCPPTLPAGVTTWHFHQTSQRGQSIGTEAMRYMDYNRFNGSDQDLKAFIGLPDPQPVTCPLDNLPCTGGKYLETI